MAFYFHFLEQFHNDIKTNEIHILIKYYFLCFAYRRYNILHARFIHDGSAAGSCCLNLMFNRPCGWSPEPSILMLYLIGMRPKCIWIEIDATTRARSSTVICIVSFWSCTEIIDSWLRRKLGSWLALIEIADSLLWPL